MNKFIRLLVVFISIYFVSSCGHKNNLPDSIKLKVVSSTEAGSLINSDWNFLDDNLGTIFPRSSIDKYLACDEHDSFHINRLLLIHDDLSKFPGTYQNAHVHPISYQCDILKGQYQYTFNIPAADHHVLMYKTDKNQILDRFVLDMRR